MSEKVLNRKKKRRKKIPAAGGFKTPVTISRLYNVNEEKTKKLIKTFAKVNGEMPTTFITAIKTKNQEGKACIKAFKYGILDTLGIFVDDDGNLVLAIDGDVELMVGEYDAKDIAKVAAAREGAIITKQKVGGNEVEVLEVPSEEVEEVVEKPKKRRKKAPVEKKVPTAKKKRRSKPVYEVDDDEILTR